MNEKEKSQKKPAKKQATKKEPIKEVKINKPKKIEEPKVEEPKVIEETLIKETELIKKKTVNFTLFEVVILLIIVALISGLLGYIVKDTLSGDGEIRYTSSSREIQVFIEEYNRILQYYHGDVDKTELISEAIRGMLNSLDDHSGFLEDTMSNNFRITLRGRYEGLGIHIINTTEGIRIVSIFENSPAADANLQVGDILISLNGNSLEGTSTSEFVNTIQTSSRRTFDLVIQRDNQEIEVRITKRNIEIQSVHSEMLSNNMGYIKVDVFAENTFDQFNTALRQLERDGLESLIIDLRGNTGGHLNIVERILGLFLDRSNVIYQTQTQNETNKVYSRGRTTKTYPIVILIDEYSASGSEIMALALSEQLDAHLIGMTTSGKGTVQQIQDIGNFGSYKFTTKRWLSPNGKSIDRVGIKPDLEVELSEQFKENPIRANDNQFQAARNYLRNRG